MRPTQLDLFPKPVTIHFDPAASPLLLLACSGTKAASRAPAMEVYQGVMYQTFRTHVRGDAPPEVVILSARHGFIGPGEPIEPYDQRMTLERADEMLERLHQCTSAARWPRRVGGVFLVGGKEYRRVMRAAIGSMGAADLPVREVCGGIGLQRSQLAGFLGGLAPAFAEVIGSHPNGTALFLRYGQFAVGDTVALSEPCRPSLEPKRAVLRELFVGPTGRPMACADVDDVVAGRPKVVTRWVSLAYVRAVAILPNRGDPRDCEQRWSHRRCG